MNLIPIEKAHGLLAVFLRAGVYIQELAKATGLSETTLQTILQKKQKSVQSTTYEALLDELMRRRDADPQFRAELERIKQGLPEDTVAEEEDQEEAETADDTVEDEDDDPEIDDDTEEDTAGDDEECDDEELAAAAGDDIDLSTTFNRTEILILAKSFKYWSDSIIERLNEAATGQKGDA